MPTLSAAAVAILRIMTCFPLIDIQFVTLYLLSVIHHAVARDRFPMLGEALSPSIRPSPFGSGLPAHPGQGQGAALSGGRHGRRADQGFDTLIVPGQEHLQQSARRSATDP
jgi:hypothetical protein